MLEFTLNIEGVFADGTGMSRQVSWPHDNAPALGDQIEVDPDLPDMAVNYRCWTLDGSLKEVSVDTTAIRGFAFDEEDIALLRELGFDQLT